MKRFLDLSSYLKIPDIKLTTHSHLVDMECNNLIKLDPNKSTASVKKEAALSYYEDLTAMVFLVKITIDSDP